MLGEALVTDRVSADQCEWVGFRQVLETGQTRQCWLDRLEAHFHLFVQRLQASGHLTHHIILGQLLAQLFLCGFKLLIKYLLRLPNLLDFLLELLELYNGESLLFFVFEDSFDFVGDLFLNDFKWGLDIFKFFLGFIQLCFQLAILSNHVTWVWAHFFQVCKRFVKLELDLSLLTHEVLRPCLQCLAYILKLILKLFGVFSSLT